MRKVLNFGPFLFGRSAHNLEDTHQFVFFFLAGEQRLHVAHLCEDAAHRPDIDIVGVFLRTQQNIGRPIPQGDHFMGETFRGDARCASESKVCDFEFVVIGDQQVLGLEVTMEDLFLMAVADPLQQLVGETLCIGIRSTLTSSGAIPFSRPTFVMNFLRSYSRYSNTSSSFLLEWITSFSCTMLG